jgi:hypothetical protein
MGLLDALLSSARYALQAEAGFPRVGLENPAPRIPVGLRIATVEAPTVEVLSGDFDQFRVNAQLLRDGAMKGDAAFVDPLVPSERNTHASIISTCR